MIMAYNRFAKKALHIVLAAVSVVTEEDPPWVGPRTMAKNRCRELSADYVVHFLVRPLC